MEKVKCSPLVDYEGIRLIVRAVYRETGIDLRDEEMGGRERVNRQGKLSTRIKRNMKKIHNITLSDTLVTNIGNAMNKHSMSETEYLVEYASDLYGTVGKFGDNGSCFKPRGMGRHNLRDMHDSGNYSAFRVYHANGNKLARAWAYHAPDGARVLFNGYGLYLDKIALLAGCLDESQPRRVKLSGRIYINTPHAYAIGGDKKDYFLSMEDKPIDYRCTQCDCAVGNGDLVYSDGNENGYCQACYDNIYWACYSCGDVQNRETTPPTLAYAGDQRRELCSDCLSRHYQKCRDCDHYHHVASCHQVYPSMEYVCRVCIQNHKRCVGCNNALEIDGGHKIFGRRHRYSFFVTCGPCREEYYRCDNCHVDHFNRNCPRCGRFGRRLFLEAQNQQELSRGEK